MPAAPSIDCRAPITVAIARLDDLIALGVRSLFKDHPSASIVADDIAYDRLSVVLRTHRPAVLILDVGKLDHLGRVRELSLQHPQTRLVLLGDHLSSIESAQLLAFGASACLSKETQGRDLINAIHLAARGMQLMPLGPHDAHGVQVRDSLLTPREGDVLQLLRKGLSNAQIAVALHIGVETVRSHARGIYRKLGVSSRRALIALASSPQSRPTENVERHPRRPASTARHKRRQPHD